MPVPLPSLPPGVAAWATAWPAAGTVAGAVACGAFLLVLAWLSVIDLRIRRLPDRIVLPTLTAGLLLNAALQVVTTPQDAVLGALSGYGLLWLLSALWCVRSGLGGSRSAAFGGGDLKLAAMIGAWVGLSALPAALLVAFVGGTAAVLPGLALGRCRLSHQIPFGPALAAGGAAAILAGPTLNAVLFGV